MRIRILPTRTHGNHVHTHEIEILDAENTGTIEVEQVQEEDMTTPRDVYGPFGIPPTNQPNEINPEDLRGYDPQRRAVRDDVLTEAWPANVKRTYDEYQDHSIADRHQNHQHLSRLQLMGEQAIQNMIASNHALTQNMINNTNIASANLIAQTNAVQQQVARGMANNVGYDALGQAQAYAHRDVAVNKTWNVDETDWAAMQGFRAADEHVAPSPHVHHNSPEENLA